MIPFPNSVQLLRTQLQKVGVINNWLIPLPDAFAYDIPWSESIIEKVAGFADFLMAQQVSKVHPEMIALAFWFRKSNLKRLSEMVDSKGNLVKEGRVLHIAPANVDTVFLYSVLLSVLCGNANIVRVSSRSGDVTWQLINLLRIFNDTCLPLSLASKISVIEYDAGQVAITESLSHWSDLRVVWGGDNAIAAISSILPDKAQISFPDRFSYCVLHLDNDTDLKRLAGQMFADIAPFNQQACSSPKAIYWLNTPVILQAEFWQFFSERVANEATTLTTANRIEQLVYLQQIMMRGEGCPLASKIPGEELKGFPGGRGMGMMSVCTLFEITSSVLSSHPGHGLILQADIESIDGLPQHEKLQTVTTNIDLLFNSAELSEAKRVVRTGQALAFDHVWDGKNLINAFMELAPPDIVN